MTATITRPALRYYGGKWRIAPWILRHMPAHQCYVEPFGGGGSVLLRKPPSPFEVYNDRDETVVTFFRVLREQPDELVRRLEMTPWARAELRACYLPTADPVERARRHFVRSMQGYFGGTRKSWQGWRFQKAHAVGRSSVASWGTFEYLTAHARRLQAVQIECDDATAVIRRFDQQQTLFYVDPPYPRSTRGARWGADGYVYEMTDADHEALAALLHDVQGMVLLSSYPSALYERLYAGWPRAEREARDGLAQRRREVLWLSPRTAGAVAQRSLFDVHEVNA